MKKRTLPKYPNGGPTKKPKYSLKMNTERLPSDNTSSYTKPHAYVNPDNRPREPLLEIMNETILDQTHGGRGFNIGKQAGIFIKNPNLFSGAQLGLEFVKSATPVAGDLAANTGQVLLEMIKDKKDNKYSNGGEIMKKRSLKKYNNGGMAKDLTSTAANLAVPGLGTAISFTDSMITNPDGSPKDGIAGFASRINPLSNIGRIAEGKDVGRSLLNLTPFGAAFEATGLNDRMFGQSDYTIEADRLKRQEQSKELTQRRLGTMNSPMTGLSTNNNNMYPYGGTVNQDQPGAIAELELQEQMQLPDGTVMGVDGPSHSEGGIEVNVPEGTKVFSDRLKNGKRTFAQHAKSINNKIAKLDKKPDSQAKSNTEMLFNQQLDNLFNTQEEMKAIKEETKQRRMFAKGGRIPAHNVTLMPNGGLTHYSGLDGDPSIIQPIFGVRSNPPKPLGKTMLTPPNINNGQPFSQSQIDAITGQGQNPTNSFKLSPQMMGYATQGITNAMQNQQINSVRKPRTIKDVNFSAGRRPGYVDYSAERAAIDAETAGARRGLTLGSGSYSTQAANLQKIRNAQLAGKGRSFQTERNTNTQLDNAYNSAQAAAYNQGVQANLGIDQYNLENAYNFDLWKACNKMKSTGSMGDNVTNMFNNQISKDNQMAYWNVMKNMFEKKVAADTGMPNKKYGGTVKRSLKK